MMELKDLINDFLYKKGFFSNRTDFTLELLKGCVVFPEKLSFSRPAINGIFVGNSIHSMAVDLMKAGLSKERIVEYVESLYPLSHKQSETFNALYGEKTYEEVLRDKVTTSTVFEGVTSEIMSERLAQLFYEIIEKASVQSSKAISSSQQGLQRIYTITAEEKEAIGNICYLLCKGLRDVQRRTDEIDRKQHELRELNDKDPDSLWREHLETDIEKLKQKIDQSFKELVGLCNDLVICLADIKHLHPSLERLNEIAVSIQAKPDVYRITCPDSFRYSALSLAVSDFNRFFELLKRDLAAL